MSDSLGDRMKRYEQSTRYVLPRRTWAVIRVDGRAFHSLLKGADKPFDYFFMAHMHRVARDLCAEIAGSVFAYTQSDEISVLVQDFAEHGTEPWFGGVVQKMASISAASATLAFNVRNNQFGRGVFDSRVFTLPTATEVANYFIWRQKDAVRNSIQMAARAHFTHRECLFLHTDQLQEKLWAEAKVNWNDYPDAAKRGTVVSRLLLDRAWVSHPAPHFTFERDSFLWQQIPRQEDW